MNTMGCTIKQEPDFGVSNVDDSCRCAHKCIQGKAESTIVTRKELVSYSRDQIVISLNGDFNKIIYSKRTFLTTANKDANKAAQMLRICQAIG